MSTFLYTVIIYPLIEIIEFSFMLFYDVFKIPGIAVIGVSLAVSFLCLPLYIVAERWQQVQRDTEKALDPGIRRIKTAFKGDEQYMILSTFYKQNHYNPIMALRSSFGLLIQIPFFIAAYSFLSNLPVLQGYSFYFIHNMGTPDALFSIGSFPINVLPIAMTIINIIAGAIYTKGFKLKEKIQIYAMALVFLVLLYNSPSGLVLYWTMNNIFSLVKNIFYKIKKPLRVLYLLLCVCVLFLDWYLLFKHNGFFHKRIILVAAATLLLLVPLVVKCISHMLDTTFAPLVNDHKKRFALFAVSFASLCILTGLIIPSYVIKSSVVEFSNIDSCGSPLSFLNATFLQSIGIFIFWPVCIYFLFHRRIQTLITVTGVILLFCGLLNAFVFSGNYGTLTRLIVLTGSFSTPAQRTFNYINAACIVVLLAALFFVFKLNKQKYMTGACVIFLLAATSISIIHEVQIQTSYKSYNNSVASSIEQKKSISPVFTLSKTGKNVVVFMLDRAQNAYVKPIFDTYPELYDQFDGFTLYKNTVSFNRCTLMGAAPLFGGYEYTPAEMNKRSDEKMIDKQNEALLVLPRIFTEQSSFSATIADSSWANYSWVPDMSITKPYPKISGVNVERKYSGLWIEEHPGCVKENMTSSAIKRNLLWFSIFKQAPAILREGLYDDGMWFSSDDTNNDISEYIDCYSELDYLPKLTTIIDTTQNSFTSITNEITHCDIILSAPDFIPSSGPQNPGACPIANAGSFSSNASAYRVLAKYISWLKQNGCYDNTRIILVADHGAEIPEAIEYDFPGWDASKTPAVPNPNVFHPLLMVKDFNAHGKMSEEKDTLMTNADTPLIALQGLIDKPFNPFTKKAMKADDDKVSSGIAITNTWSPDSNKTNTLNIASDEWYTVSGDISKQENWGQLSK